VIVIVASEVVGDDVSLDDVRSEFERQDAAWPGAPLFAEHGERAVVVAALVEQLGDGLSEHDGSVQVEQLKTVTPGRLHAASLGGVYIHRFSRPEPHRFTRLHSPACQRNPCPSRRARTLTWS
jgi:hypothetical protein